MSMPKGRASLLTSESDFAASVTKSVSFVNAKPFVKTFTRSMGCRYNGILMTEPAAALLPVFKKTRSGEKQMRGARSCPLKVRSSAARSLLLSSSKLSTVEFERCKWQIETRISCRPCSAGFARTYS